MPNEASVALHSKLEFREVGMLQAVGRKFGNYIDIAPWQRRRVPLVGMSKASHDLALAAYFPITSIWKEFGIIGGRGPRIHGGALEGGPAAGVVPGVRAGAGGTGPYSAVMVRI